MHISDKDKDKPPFSLAPPSSSRSGYANPETEQRTQTGKNEQNVPKQLGQYRTGNSAEETQQHQCCTNTQRKKRTLPPPLPLSVNDWDHTRRELGNKHLDVLLKHRLVLADLFGARRARHQHVGEERDEFVERQGLITRVLQVRSDAGKVEGVEEEERRLLAQTQQRDRLQNKREEQGTIVLNGGRAWGFIVAH